MKHLYLSLTNQALPIVVEIIAFGIQTVKVFLMNWYNLHHGHVL
jgi:hypothetical protein